MPILDWNLQETWDNAYLLNRTDGQPGQVHYVGICSMHRAAAGQAAKIIQALNITSADTILILGCGFGWIANQIALQSGATVAAVDTSQYIQDGKAANADQGVEILNADVSAGSGRAAIRQALGITGNQKATYAITEDVMDTLTDTECQQLSTFLNNIADTVVHWVQLKVDGFLGDGVTPIQDPVGYNWKTIDEWKALLPNDLFIICSTDVLA